MTVYNFNIKKINTGNNTSSLLFLTACRNPNSICSHLYFSPLACPDLLLFLANHPNFYDKYLPLALIRPSIFPIYRLPLGLGIF